MSRSAGGGLHHQAETILQFQDNGDDLMTNRIPRAKYNLSARAETLSLSGPMAASMLPGSSRPF